MVDDTAASHASSSMVEPQHHLGVGHGTWQARLVGWNPAPCCGPIHCVGQSLIYSIVNISKEVQHRVWKRCLVSVLSTEYARLKF